jgi:tetratricopeptide (TPR) repeat protein
VNKGAAVDIDHLEKAVLNQPDSALAHARLGSALVQLGFPGRGEKSLLRAVEIDPGLVQAWVNLGGARLARWDFQGCVEANQKALESEPDLVGARLNLGLGYLYLGQTEAMMEAFEYVLGLQPENAPAHYYLAVGYRAQGNLELAVQYLARAIGLGHSPDTDFVRAIENELRESNEQPLAFLEVGPDPEAEDPEVGKE